MVQLILATTTMMESEVEESDVMSNSDTTVASTTDPTLNSLTSEIINIIL